MLLLALTVSIGAIASLTVAYVAQFRIYISTVTRTTTHVWAASVAFAVGTMSLTLEAGVNDVPNAIVAGLMAANLVLFVSLLVVRDKS